SQYNTVRQTLEEIGAGGKPTIVVFNKIDAYKPAPHDPHDLEPKREDQYTLEEMERTWMARITHTDPDSDEAIFISATRKDNIDVLRKLMYERVKAIHIARYPYEKDLLFQDWTLEEE
ncbi:MAG: GTPase HflX, partial [Flavobacteriales bacterium]